MTKRYQVLARRYRPQLFCDVVGQEAAVTTLKNAIRFDKVSHAYLFCGSRGVGKTTLARLFAKALNCAALTPEFEPCNSCPYCLEIASGQSLDVIEIDGASNRGIDDIRQINETVGYAPSHGQYKIYIIAQFSEGSLRDAESLFDQILCFATGPITAAVVRQSLGLVPQELFLNLDNAFSQYNLAYAFELVDQLFQTGKDLAHFLEQLIEHYRNLTLARTLGAHHPSASLYTQQQCLHILDLLIQAESSFQKSAFPRITLESILLQIIRSKNRIPVEVLVRKLTQSEKLEEILPVLENPAPVIEAPPPKAPPPPAVENPAPVIEVPAPPAVESKPAPIIEAPVLKEAPPIVEEPPLLKPVPFNPFTAAPEPVAPSPPSAIEPAPPVAVKTAPVAAQPAPVEKKVQPVSNKPQSHYDTVIRFAAIELEGIVK